MISQSSARSGGNSRPQLCSQLVAFFLRAESPHSECFLTLSRLIKRLLPGDFSVRVDGKAYNPRTRVEGGTKQDSLAFRRILSILANSCHYAHLRLGVFLCIGTKPRRQWIIVNAPMKHIRCLRHPHRRCMKLKMVISMLITIN